MRLLILSPDRFRRSVTVAIILALSLGLCASRGVNAPFLSESDAGASGPCGTATPVTWTQVTAGASLTVTTGCTSFYVRVDTSGARGTITLPASTVTLDGQVVTIKSIGSNLLGTAINPGTGNQLEDPNNAGTFLATATSGVINAQGGWSLSWKYDATNKQWVEFK